MSDRVRVEIIIKPEDKEKITSAFKNNEVVGEYPISGGKLLLELDEVRYGGCDVLKKLAEDVDFVGVSYGGQEFSAFHFHSVDTEEFHTVESGHSGLGYVVYYDLDKQVPQQNVINIMAYIDAHNKFVKGA